MIHLELVSPVAIGLPIVIALLLFALLTLYDYRRPISHNERRRRAGQRIPRIALFATVLAYLTAISALVLVTTLDLTSRVFLVGPILQLTALLAYLLVPGLTGLAMSIVPALLWKEPARVLVLRRFDRGGSSRSLRRYLRERVAPLGHVYTLADRDIKVRWYVRFPVVLTQLAFLHFRAGVVRDERGVRSLLRSLDLRWARNLNWFVSWEKTFAVRSSDAAWQALVQALGSRVDAVLIDLSEPSENLAWEIQHLVEQGAISKTILLTDMRRRQVAEQWLTRWRGSGLGDRFVAYDREPDRVVAMLVGSVGDSVAAPSPAWKRYRWHRQVVAAARMLSPFGAAALVLSWVLLAPAARLYLSEDGFLRRQILMLEHPSSERRAAAVGRLRDWARRQLASSERQRLKAPEGLFFGLRAAWEVSPELRAQIAPMLATFESASFAGVDLSWSVLRDLPDEHLEIKRVAVENLRGQPFLFSGVKEALSARARAPASTRRSRQVDLLILSLLDPGDYWRLQAELLSDPAMRKWALETLTGSAEARSVPLDTFDGSGMVAALEELWDEAPSLRPEADLLLASLVEPSEYWEFHVRFLRDQAERRQALERLLRSAESGIVLRGVFAVDRVADALKQLWDEEPSLRREIAQLLRPLSGRGAEALAWRVLQQLPDTELASKRVAVEVLSRRMFALRELTDFTLLRLQRGTSSRNRTAAREVNLMLVDAIAELGRDSDDARSLEALAAAADDPEVRAAALTAAANRTRRF